MRFAKRVCGVLGAVILMSSAPAFCDDISQAGARIVSKYGPAVVTIQLVAKMTISFGGKDGAKEEFKAETTGLVIDPSGLVVTALSATDPNDIMRRFMPSRVQMSTQIVSIKLIFQDGSELPAQIALRDKDQDLVFIRLKTKPAKPLVAVDLAKETKPALLDRTVNLSRLGVIASRALSVGEDRIMSIVEKPRTFYVSGAQSEASGMAVFGLDEGLVGIVVLRIAPSSASNSVSMMSDMKQGMLPIILPAAEIREIAAQALGK